MSSAVESTSLQNSDTRVNADLRWTILRLVIAAIILTAAFMKAWQLATTPSLGEGLLHARWFNILVVEFELFFGIWLIFGMLPKLTWLASVGLFSIFASVSLYKAISGEASCGCFGAATINPWITMALDLGVIGLLMCTRQRGMICDFSDLLNSLPLRESALCVGLFIVMGATTYGWIAQMRYERLNEVGQVLDGNVVKLEPAAWIDKEFPLRDYIVDGHELAQDKRFLLLSRPGCSDCEKVKKNLIQSAGNETVSVSILDISGEKTILSSTEDRVSKFLLVSEINWIAETPIMIELKDGVVRNMRSRKELLSNDNDIPLGNASVDGRRGFQ